MKSTPSEFNEEIQRLRHLNPYASESDENAVKLAHEDLLSAKDYLTNPRFPCKMYATDVLRTAAELAPALLTDEIVQDCQRIFMKCNASSQINIIKILSTLGRDDAIPFLEKVRDDRTRPNASSLVSQDGRYMMKSFRDETQPDLVSYEAAKALDKIRSNNS